MAVGLSGTITVAILVAAVVLLVTGRLRSDLVALLVVVALGATGVLSPQETFSGFSSPAVIAIASVFVLAEGIYLTGGSDRVGEWLVERAGRSEAKLVAVIMAAGALLSLFMNNIAAASVLLPAVSGAAKRTGLSPSRLLMPLAFGTILGGMATLFTTVNILVSGLLRESGLHGFGVLDFLPVGAPMAIAGIIFMVSGGRRFLPDHSLADRYARAATAASLTDLYGLGERLFRVRIPAGSYLIGEPLVASELRERFQASVVAIERVGHTTPAPTPDTVLMAGDIVTLDGDIEHFRRQDQEPFFEILAGDTADKDLVSPDVVIAEAILAPRSGLIGHTLKESKFREQYGFSALGIWRAGKPLSGGVADTALQFGDALLLQGPWARLAVLRGDRDLIVLDEEGLHQGIRRPAKLPLALLIMAAAIVVAAAGWLPTAETMLGGGLLMILAGCLTLEEAYSAIEGRSVILVAGMLPLGVALSKSGVASAVAGALLGVVGPLGWLALVASLFVIAMALTQFVGGPVVATILAPIAIQSGQQFQADPRMMALTVALAASVAFMTPLGHPVNILVMSPGGYTFADYAKVGAPLTVVVTATAIIMLWLLHLPPV